jgi:hypothetical protein
MVSSRPRMQLDRTWGDAVGGRAITSAYATSATHRSGPGSHGCYMIIELLPADSAAVVWPPQLVSWSRSGGGPSGSFPSGRPRPVAPRPARRPALIVDEFRQLDCAHPKTGASLRYNLLVARNYDSIRRRQKWWRCRENVVIVTTIGAPESTTLEPSPRTEVAVRGNVVRLSEANAARSQPMCELDADWTTCDERCVARPRLDDESPRDQPDRSRCGAGDTRFGRRASPVPCEASYRVRRRGSPGRP